MVRKGLNFPVTYRTSVLPTEVGPIDDLALPSKETLMCQKTCEVFGEYLWKYNTDFVHFWSESAKQNESKWSNLPKKMLPEIFPLFSISIFFMFLGETNS